MKNPTKQDLFTDTWFWKGIDWKLHQPPLFHEDLVMKSSKLYSVNSVHFMMAVILIHLTSVAVEQYYSDFWPDSNL